ncbi:MAG: hypothetical protein CMH98_06425 [Oceanospirillaceae bacterium]|nr:hypothetical protein [Oceanospirillaceae bacterium]|tara:strand:+ start:23955 stop:24923 length:969 start_codon:yes stop_codon:yes gene_type:complete
MRITQLSPLLILVLATLPGLTACSQGKEPAETYEVARQGVYSATFSADGDSLMVGSIHHGGSLWQMPPPERVYDWNHKADGVSNLTHSAFSADGRYVATTDNRTIVLWQRDTGEAVWFWNAPGDIEDIELTTDGRYALLAMRDFTATLFDIQNGGIRHRLAHDGIVYDVSIDHDGMLAASGSDDLNARLWNLENGELLHTIHHNNQVKTVQLSADGRLLFTSALNESGKIWDTASGQLLKEIPAKSGHFSAAKFSATDTRLLTGSSSGQITLWNVSTGEVIDQWRAKPRDAWVSTHVLIEDVSFASSEWRAAGTNGLLYFLR